MTKRSDSGKTGRDAAGRKAAAEKPAAAPAIDPKWTWHYRTLLRLRDRLLQENRAKRHEAVGAVEPHSMHPADSATDEFDHDLALTLLAREESASTEVNDAITRIIEGRYGVCEETGRRIPAARLRALPWCHYTREVEERLEKAGVVQKARIPEAVSLRGVTTEIPGTGVLPPEGMEGEPDRPEETEAAKVVEERATSAADEIEPTPPAAESPSHAPRPRSASPPPRRG